MELSFGAALKFHETTRGGVSNRGNNSDFNNEFNHGVSPFNEQVGLSCVVVSYGLEIR